jgi:hypothetical protein
MDPLIGCTLAHAEQAPLHHLEVVGLEVGEEEKQPIFRRRQGAVLVHAKPAGGAGCPSKPPLPHMHLERRFERRDQLVKLVAGQAGEIQELYGAGLHIGKPDTGHVWDLLSWETQYTINRDKLIGFTSKFGRTGRTNCYKLSVQGCALEESLLKCLVFYLSAWLRHDDFHGLHAG